MINKFLVLFLLFASSLYGQVTSSTWTTFEFLWADSVFQNPARRLTIDTSGTVWGALAGGVAKQASDSTFTTYLTADSSWIETSLNNAICIYADSSGTIWIGTGAGLKTLDQMDWALETLYTGDDYGTAQDKITAIGGQGGEVTDPTTIYFAIYGGGLIYHGLDSLFYDFTDSIFGNVIYCIEKDSSGNMWFGTDSGATLYQDGYWFSYTEDDGLPSRHVFSIAADSGAIWIGTTGGAILYDGDTTWTDLSDSTLSRTIRSIALEGDSVTWFATDSGLMRYEPAALYPYSPWTRFTKTSTGDSLPIDIINDVKIDSAGMIWLATPAGIVRFESTIE